MYFSIQYINNIETEKFCIHTEITWNYFQDRVCLIENQCYDDDDSHPSENCAKCDVDSSGDDWTIDVSICNIQ